MTHVAQVTCPHDCPDSCLIDVTVVEGRATRVAASKEHPFTRGALCAKVNKLLDRVYAPDRLLYPVRRIGPKGPGAQFERISWDEGITTIAAKMKEAITAHGPQSILPYSYRGNNGVYQSNAIDRRFLSRPSAPRPWPAPSAPAVCTELSRTGTFSSALRPMAWSKAS